MTVTANLSLPRLHARDVMLRLPEPAVTEPFVIVQAYVATTPNVVG